MLNCFVKINLALVSPLRLRPIKTIWVHIKGGLKVELAQGVVCLWHFFKFVLVLIANDVVVGNSEDCVLHNVVRKATGVTPSSQPDPSLTLSELL